jgi:hypothetical protein
MLTQDQLRADVEAYLAETGMKPTTFGRLALGDPNFVFDLRKNRSPSLKLAEKVYDFMRERRAA